MAKIEKQAEGQTFSVQFNLMMLFIFLSLGFSDSRIDENEPVRFGFKESDLGQVVVKIFNDVFFEAVCMLNNRFSLLSVILQVLIKRVIKVNHKTDISLIFLTDRPRPILYL